MINFSISKVSAMKSLFASLALLLVISAGAQGPNVLAYWAQNNNNLPSSGFGFTPASFPQPADVGNGSLSLENFNEAVGGNGAYSSIQSFTGTTANAEAGFGSGGSLSPQGGPGLSNNGMSILLEVSTLDHEDINLSWAYRRTGTGFNSVQLAYSSDGGSSFTNFGAPFTPPSSFSTTSFDFSSIAALNDNPDVVFRITLNGATNASGNNRYDNIKVEGTMIGFPACMISSIELNNSTPCDDDVYTVDVTVNYVNNPNSGDLALELPDGSELFVEASSLPSAGSYTFTGVELPADDMDQVLTATFFGDESGACTLSTTAPAVAPCSFPLELSGCNNLAADYDATQDIYTLSTTCAKNSFTQDRGIFATTTACGSVVVEAKLESIAPTSGYAGITIRESSAPGAKTFSLVQYPGGRKQVETRKVDNAQHTIYWAANWTIFYQYIRIVRTGTLFQAYASFNGNNWQLMFSQYINMSNCAEAGLLVYAGTEGSMTQATFSGFSISGANSLQQANSDEVASEQVRTGKQELSAPSVLNGRSAELADFSVFPNPAVDELNISFEQTTAAEASIRILSMDGQRIYEGVHPTQGAVVNLPLGPLNLPNGIYLINVATDDEVRTKRFVKAGNF